METNNIVTVSIVQKFFTKNSKRKREIKQHAGNKVLINHLRALDNPFLAFSVNVVTKQ